MPNPLRPIQGAIAKAQKQRARSQEKRRLAGRQQDTLREGQRLRETIEKKGRQYAAGKKAEARREAARESLHAALRLEMLQRPDVRRWAPRAVAAVAVVSLIGNVLQYFRYSPWRPLVTVGSRVVRQREFQADLDGVAGKTVLNRIVYDELIRQAAAKAGLMPTAADVDARLTEMKRHSPRGLPDDPALWDRVRVQMALENLRLRGINATDAEVAAFYAAHKAQFAVPSRTVTTLVMTASDADAARAVRLLAAGKTEAEVAAQPGLHVAGVGGFNINLDVLPPAVRQAVGRTAMNLPIGAIKTLPVGPHAFFTLRPQRREDGSLPVLPQIHDEVARLVRLQKAPTEGAELATLYHANPPSFDMARYANYFSDLPAADAKPASGPKTASLPPAEAH